MSRFSSSSSTPVPPLASLTPLKPPTPLMLATRNPGKVKELAGALAQYGFEVRGMPPDVPSAEETGVTFEENALLKARAVADALGLPALADDSGLEVDALGGAPGVRSARYAEDMPVLEGESTDERNNRKLLAALAGVPAPRTARFHCCMALVFPGGIQPDIVAHGVWEGSMTQTPRGRNGFGYDPLFLDPQSGLSSAELSPEEKMARSHRGKALAALLAELDRRHGS